MLLKCQIALIIILLVSCKSETISENKTIVILYDLSSSTNNGSRAKYIENTQLIINDLQPGDELVCEAITDKSVREKSIIHKLVSDPFQATTTNKIGKSAQENKAQKEFEAKRTQANLQIAQFIADTLQQFPQTDIFSALTLVRTVYDNFPNSKQVLIIMSDMLVSDNKYQFEKNTPTKEQTLAIIEALKKQSMMPNLAETTIYVVGADAGSNEKYYGIRSFWQTYFIATGTELPENKYSAHLLHFDE